MKLVLGDIFGQKAPNLQEMIRKKFTNGIQKLEFSARVGTIMNEKYLTSCCARIFFEKVYLIKAGIGAY